MTHCMHHIALGARSVESLAAFYAEAFDLPEVTRHRDDLGLRSVWLRLGAVVLMIERCHGVRPLQEGVAPGWFLVAFDAGGRREAIREELSARGVEREASTTFSDYYRDPEGNRFAVSEYDFAFEAE